MELSGLEYEALLIRRDYVQDLHLLNIEGLAAIVAPSPDLLNASIQAAQDKRDAAPVPRAPIARRERCVTLESLLA